MRTHRDAALRLISENQDQMREGVELLVKRQMPTILLACRGSGERPLLDEQADRLYVEILSLAYNMFALGYSIGKISNKP